MTNTWLFGHDSLAEEVLGILENKNNSTIVISQAQDLVAYAEHLEKKVYADFLQLARTKPKRPSCVYLLFDDDQTNLELALNIDKAFPNVPILIRMFQTEIRDFVKAMLPFCEVVDASEITAPIFAHLALYGDRDKAPKAVAHPAWGRDSAPRKKLFSFRQKMNFYYDKKISFLLLFLFVLLCGGTVVLHELTHFSWFDAFYHSVIISHGEMDIETNGSPLAAKIYVLAMFMGGIIALTMLYAVVTDFFVKIRLAKTLGKFPMPQSGHTVICGMGKIGSRVMKELYEEGVPLIGVDHKENAPGMQLAKTLQVHTQKGSITDAYLLSTLNLEKAKTVLILSDSDMHNVECAMEVKKINPHLRIIVRLFDADLAHRAAGSGMIDQSCSVSQTAAPAIVQEAQKICSGSTLTTNNKVQYN